MIRVLIAHQSTIPHYRIGFYNELRKILSESYSFKVVFDYNKKNSVRIFKESVDTSKFTFDIESVKTIFLYKNKIIYQTFFFKALLYDVIIVEDAINNLTYPIVNILRLFGKKIILWGHGRNRQLDKLNIFTLGIQFVRQILLVNSVAYLAYTDGVKAYLGNITNPQKIFVINNTIDIEYNRHIYNKLIASKEEITIPEKLTDKTTLIYVGRIQKRKKIDYLIKAFQMIHNTVHNIKLIIIGDGDNEIINELKRTDNIVYYSSITEPEILGKYLQRSDLFVLPGAVGLAPIQALCYDVIPVLISSSYHGPEIDYLVNEYNSVILPVSTTEKEYADSIISLLSDRQRLNNLRNNAWSSIKHLTQKNMAINFKKAIDYVLKEIR